MGWTVNFGRYPAVGGGLCRHEAARSPCVPTLVRAGSEVFPAPGLRTARQTVPNGRESPLPHGTYHKPRTLAILTPVLDGSMGLLWNFGAFETRRRRGNLRDGANEVNRVDLDSPSFLYGWPPETSATGSKTLPSRGSIPPARAIFGAGELRGGPIAQTACQGQLGRTLSH